MGGLEGSSNLSTRLSNFIESTSTLDNERVYAVAVSGGPDSMALANLLVEFVLSADKELHILTVDHGLRAESKLEAESVGQWVSSFKSEKIHHKILTWAEEKPDKALMEAARHARYNLMTDYCSENNIKILFVGHHMDDQAETILFRLSKGSGLDGLGGMEAMYTYSPKLMLVRPLLETSKVELIEYCQEHDVSYISDPSNDKQEYARPRLRKSQAILEEEGLTSARLSITAKRLQRARKALETISTEVYEDTIRLEGKDYLALDWIYLKDQPEEIAFRVLSMALTNMSDINGTYNVRMKRLESLFFDLWQLNDLSLFKRRALGGCLFSFDKKSEYLHIEKE